MKKLNKGKQHLENDGSLWSLSLSQTPIWLILYALMIHMHICTYICAYIQNLRINTLMIHINIYIYIYTNFVYKDKCEKTNVKVVSQWARLLCIDVSYQFPLTSNFADTSLSFWWIQHCDYTFPFFFLMYVETHS